MNWAKALLLLPLARHDFVVFLFFFSLSVYCLLAYNFGYRRWEKNAIVGAEANARLSFDGLREEEIVCVRLFHLMEIVEPQEVVAEIKKRAAQERESKNV